MAATAGTATMLQNLKFGWYGATPLSQGTDIRNKCKPLLLYRSQHHLRCALQGWLQYGAARQAKREDLTAALQLYQDRLRREGCAAWLHAGLARHSRCTETHAVHQVGPCAGCCLTHAGSLARGRPGQMMLVAGLSLHRS